MGPLGLFFGLMSGLKTFLGPAYIDLQLLFWKYSSVLLFKNFPGWVAGWLGGGLENLILMKTQSSAQTWTWTLDFDLGFVNFGINQDKNQL